MKIPFPFHKFSSLFYWNTMRLAKNKIKMSFQFLGGFWSSKIQAQFYYYFLNDYKQETRKHPRINGFDFWRFKRGRNNILAFLAFFFFPRNILVCSQEVLRAIFLPFQKTFIIYNIRMPQHKYKGTNEISSTLNLRHFDQISSDFV